MNFTENWHLIKEDLEVRVKKVVVFPFFFFFKINFDFFIFFIFECNSSNLTIKVSSFKCQSLYFEEVIARKVRSGFLLVIPPLPLPSSPPPTSPPPQNATFSKAQYSWPCSALILLVSFRIHVSLNSNYDTTQKE